MQTKMRQTKRPLDASDHDGQLPENKLHWWNWKD